MKRSPPPTELLVALFYAPTWAGREPCWQVDDTLVLPATPGEIRDWKGALGRPFPHRHKYMVMKFAERKGRR